MKEPMLHVREEPMQEKEGGAADLSRPSLESTLLRIANRYVGEHPPHPFVFRTFQRDGIRGTDSYYFNFDFTERFPEAKDGESVYACAKVWSDRSTTVRLRLNCCCPAVVYINGQPVYRSTSEVEIRKQRADDFEVRLKRGWSHFAVQFTKRASGFGGEFGTVSAKWQYLPFLAPGIERSGQMGWIYTKPLRGTLPELPKEGWSELGSGAEWLPVRRWSEEQLAVGQLHRLYGLQADHYAIGWAKVRLKQKGVADYTLKGSSEGKIRVLVGGKLVYASDTAGVFKVPLQEKYGVHSVVVQSFCGARDWGFRAEVWHGEDRMDWLPGGAAQGMPDAWMFLGPFSSAETPAALREPTLNGLFESAGGPVYWRVDQPETWVRPSLENALFAKWNYPLGVTLYGLLQTGRTLGRVDLIAYARSHIEACSSMAVYTMWDKERYGLPGINHQLSKIDMLDDCGSFGSVLLEAGKEGVLQGAAECAERIADYIAEGQSRLPDGTLYRVFSDSENLWADDLYMSVPFLCRYALLTGKMSYMDDAAKQFLRFKRYLFLPECKLMSHVYDFSYGTATNIPWGRGNGWVLFSLSELLAVLPAEHPDRPELIRFFQTLCKGILQCQGNRGLWHQVLTDPESYEETSCTAMFVYALSRGIRFGWLDFEDAPVEAAIRAWEGLERLAIDRQGNVHGVCRGSWYSFNPDYYKRELLPLLNDTHGIGIVLLAGVEVIRLQEWMQEEKKGGEA
ncbi:glycoside hydrolase family 88/105 protein [Paenibacillus ehimensis]|uniref:Glycoside hydrolase family 88 protein n=1 Tax=Paenibacillus ehimensis TaxID=79264 RepID=A0ABT8V993_9BACL|nr:glycoside hydrolase family 88 protein [Paenibacillus ehimensis]MDO3677422.1 glycoside hydrolase family 88 protein [Paenibacillus ehimensis]